MSNPETVGDAVGKYLSEKWKQAANVASVEKIFGGASRETYRLSLDLAGGNRNVIVRLDPPSSLIDTERSLEYNAYRCVHETGGVPVPEPLFLEEEGADLGQPFSIMAAIDGCETDVSTFTADQRAAIGRDNYRVGHSVQS